MWLGRALLSRQNNKLAAACRRQMEEKKLERTFLSGEYGSSYQMHEGTRNEDSICLSAGSTLIARQSGTYGANASRGDTTIVSLGTAGDETSGGSTDRTNFLTEKIRQKKQGKRHEKQCKCYSLTVKPV